MSTNAITTPFVAECGRAASGPRRTPRPTSAASCSDGRAGRRATGRGRTRPASAGGAPGVVGLRPGDVRRTEERHDRAVQRRREVARSAVGGDEQVAAANAGLGQAQRQRLVGEGVDAGPARQAAIRRASSRSPGRTEPARRCRGGRTSSWASAANDSACQCLAEPKAAPD